MREDGFTLIEVLIAMAITAFIAAAAYAGINNVMIGSEALRDSGERTRDLGRSFDIIDRDLRQFVERPVRDEFGNWQPSMAGGPLALYPLSVTRAGWHNSLQLPRSDLQRVHYFVEEGSLWRAYNTTLDRSVDAELQRVRLMDGVESMEVRFLANVEELQVDRDFVVDTQAWALNWVAQPGAGQQALPQAPEALELRLQLDDLGELRRIYELPER
ncbi:MAG: type II secretion system minor pseudopilin GspJ [Pseudomonadota bacterium]